MDRTYAVPTPQTDAPNTTGACSACYAASSEGPLNVRRDDLPEVRERAWELIVYAELLRAGVPRPSVKYIGGLRWQREPLRKALELPDYPVGLGVGVEEPLAEMLPSALEGVLARLPQFSVRAGDFHAESHETTYLFACHPHNGGWAPPLRFDIDELEGYARAVGGHAFVVLPCEGKAFVMSPENVRSYVRKGRLTDYDAYSSELSVRRAVTELGEALRLNLWLGIDPSVPDFGRRMERWAMNGGYRDSDIPGRLAWWQRLAADLDEQVGADDFSRVFALAGGNLWSLIKDSNY